MNMNVEKDFELNLKWSFPKGRNVVTAAILLSVILILIYSNSFDCSWHFDDYANIVNNETVHINSLSWVQLEKSLHGIVNSGRWSRPLSYLSFSLNYYFNGLDLFGYHLVNLIIHTLTAFFLYLFILNVLTLPIFKDQYRQNAHDIALLSAIFWSVNPLQVGAVTYIVQRMASMATLFYILSMYFYLKGRLADRTGRRAALFLLSFLMGILSIGSKENSAMLPVSLVLFDLILIQGFTVENIKKNLKFAVPVILITLSTGFLFFEDISAIIGDYSKRPFTGWERLISQPRVILFYISLLLYPITPRLMFIHDIDVSKSLFDPWTTILSIMIILAVLFIALMKAQRWPLICYCVIFFFLNHAIEGSFISLEMAFEHRNYLPSILFFIPISLFFVELLNRYKHRSTMRYFFALALASLIMLQGITVYIQNNIWKDEISFWHDNVEKAPRVHHARQNLAAAYFSAGRFSDAFEEANKALASHITSDFTKMAGTQGLIAHCFLLQGDQEKALLHYRESVKLNPRYHQSYYRISEIMLQREPSLNEAEDSIKKALVLNGRSSAYHLTYARILLKKSLPDLAKQEVKAALLLDPDSVESYKIMADIFKQQGQDKVSEHFSRIASTKERRMMR
jgi:tetratricopeptide (TPR) repeat protein